MLSFLSSIGGIMNSIELTARAIARFAREHEPNGNYGAVSASMSTGAKGRDYVLLSNTEGPVSALSVSKSNQIRFAGFAIG
jgi:hypothetical protein